MCWEDDRGGPGSWGSGPPCPPLPLLFHMWVPFKISLEEGVAMLKYAGEPLSTDPGSALCLRRMGPWPVVPILGHDSCQ